MGPQMFVLKGDDMQEQIQDNPRFYDLRNKWFCTPGDGTTGTIPLQDYKGHPVSRPTAPAPVVEQKKQDNFDMSALSAALNKMNSMISENSAQIRALSVAQSEGLQRMQEINESNMTQMKALADSQEKLQSIVDQNASHYIALSNSSFANQEQTKSELQSTASQTKALASQTNALASQTKVLAEGQFRLAKTCEGTMRTIENLGTTVARVSDDMSTISSAWSDAGSMSSVSTASAPFGAMARISPPPRKLNRRVKGVWYEYDDNPTTNPSPKKPALLHTPPKSPESRKAGSSALRAPPAKKIA
jgi:myosin heavy subunit